MSEFIFMFACLVWVVLIFTVILPSITDTQTPLGITDKGKVIWKGDNFCMVQTGEHDYKQVKNCDAIPPNSNVTIGLYKDNSWRVTTTP